MRDRATRGGEEHTQRFGAPTARGSSRTSTSTPNQPAVATTRQETTSHAETAEEIGHYGHHSRGARLWASASWYCIVTCCANKMQRQKKTCRHDHEPPAWRARDVPPICRPSFCVHVPPQECGGTCIHLFLVYRATLHSADSSCVFAPAA